MEKIIYYFKIDTFYEPSQNVPKDAFPVTEEYYAYLLEENSKGKLIVEGEDGKPIAIDNPKQARIDAERTIYQLKTYLDTEWRWRNERLYSELYEIQLGLRETTTETQEKIVLDRKNAVDEINRLEQEIKG